MNKTASISDQHGKRGSASLGRPPAHHVPDSDRTCNDPPPIQPQRNSWLSHAVKTATTSATHPPATKEYPRSQAERLREFEGLLFATMLPPEDLRECRRLFDYFCSRDTTDLKSLEKSETTVTSPLLCFPTSGMAPCPVNTTVGSRNSHRSRPLSSRGSSAAAAASSPPMQSRCILSSTMLHHILNHVLGLSCTLTSVQDALFHLKRHNARTTPLGISMGSSRLSPVGTGGATRLCEEQKGDVDPGTSTTTTLPGTGKAGNVPAAPSNSTTSSRSRSCSSSRSTSVERKLSPRDRTAAGGVDFPLFVRLLCWEGLERWCRTDPFDSNSLAVLPNRGKDPLTGACPLSGGSLPRHKVSVSSHRETKHTQEVSSYQELLRTEVFPILDADGDGVVGEQDLYQALCRYTPHLVLSDSAHAEQEYVRGHTSLCSASTRPTDVAQTDLPTAGPVVSTPVDSLSAPHSVFQQPPQQQGPTEVPTFSKLESQAEVLPLLPIKNSSTRTSGGVTGTPPNVSDCATARTNATQSKKDTAKREGEKRSGRREPVEKGNGRRRRSSSSSSTSDSISSTLPQPTNEVPSEIPKNKSKDVERLLCRGILQYIDDNGDGVVTWDDVLRVLDTN